MQPWSVKGRVVWLIWLLAFGTAQAGAQPAAPAQIEVVANQGHARSVLSADFSSTGRLVLSGGEDGAVKLWDVASGRLIRTFEGREGLFSPDGQRVLTGGYGAQLKLIDAATGKTIRAFEGTASYYNDSIAFSPNGQLVLSGNEEQLRLWDVATGKLMRTVDAGAVAVSFSPDGRLALSGGGTVRLWDVATGGLVRSFEVDRARIMSVAFSPDGRTILAGSREGVTRLWDVSSGELLRSFEGGAKAVFSSDGRQVLSADWDGFRAWDAATGTLIRSLEMQTRNLGSVDWSSDRRWLLSDGNDNDHPALQLRNAQTGELVRRFGGYESTATASLSQNDFQRFLTLGLGFHPLLRGGTTDEPARTFEAPEGRGTRLSPDGSRAVSFLSDTVMALWNVDTGARIGTLEGHTGPVYATAFSPDGTRLLSGSGDHMVRLWDTTTGTHLRVFTGHLGAVSSVAFSPDGRRALSGSADRIMRLWDLATGELIREFKGQLDTAYEVAFSPDERLIASAGGGAIRAWDAGSGAELAHLSLYGNGWVVTTPEGFFDVSGSGADALSLVRGLQVATLGQAYQALYRPDLVADKLAGDPGGRVREAAEKLDLADVMGSGGPPLVQFAALTDRVEDGQVDVRASLTDMGGGIGRIEWRVNGVVVAVDQGVAGDGTMSLERRLTLDPGENTIELAAYNVQGLLASLPAIATVTSAGQSVNRRPRLFVLAVGVNDYWDSRLQLNYAVPDATAIAEGLRKAGGDLYESIEIAAMLDEQVTVQQLDAKFAQIGASMRRDDVFVFFLAGHGRTENGVYYFLPYDYRHRNEQSLLSDGISIHRFQEWFARLPARKSVLLFDSCESGSIAEPRFSTRATERFVAIDKLSRAIGRTTLAAATGDALEGYRGHGVFTYTVLEAFGAAGEGKEYVGVTDLAAYIDERIPTLSQEVFEERQQPQIKIEGGNFPLLRQTYVLTGSEEEADVFVPGRPTHVVTATVKVREAPGSESAVTAELPAGARILVMTESPSGWSLVARDGRKLGYVETTSVLRLQ